MDSLDDQHNSIIFFAPGRDKEPSSNIESKILDTINSKVVVKKSN